MKKILVTGICGMIASHVLDELIHGTVQVVGVDNLSFGKMENIRHHLGNKNFQFHRMDICDRSKLERLAKGSSIVLHLAAVKKIGEKDPSLATLMESAKATESVLQAAQACGAKVVLGSTSDVYGSS